MYAENLDVIIPGAKALSVYEPVNIGSRLPISKISCGDRIEETFLFQKENLGN